MRIIVLIISVIFVLAIGLWLMGTPAPRLGDIDLPGTDLEAPPINPTEGITDVEEDGTTTQSQDTVQPPRPAQNSAGEATEQETPLEREQRLTEEEQQLLEQQEELKQQQREQVPSVLPENPPEPFTDFDRR